MYYRIIRNDMFKSKVITLTTIIFVAAAAMLVSLAAILLVNLSGALDKLMTTAQTPHFMQMHTGELNRERLAAFAEQNSNVEDYQVIEFLNMDGSQIAMGNNTLASSIQDNGFSVQSDKFDYLLDLNGEIIHAADGELYVPISYMKDGTTIVGDKAVISGRTFTVAGFLRDSQMNSSLSSSKRFLVSPNDYAEIEGFGNIEYLIEFRLKDMSALGAFETAYASAGLEANGPAVTYPLFKMINALSEGMMIGVILLVSVLVVIISFMCIRFTLLAKIEEDYREIGVMKAIGLRIADIKQIYLAKYAVIAAVGAIVGFALSLVFKGILLENIRLYMGESDNASLASWFGIIGVLLIFLAVITYVNGVLRRFRTISAAEAIRNGASQERNKGGMRFSLSGNRLLSTNVFLGIKDVLTRKKLYATMLAVLVISAFIIIVPQNLHHTISSEDFIKYMGIGDSDMRIDIQQTDHISEKAAAIMTTMSQDSSISKYTLLTTKTFKAKLDDGSEERIKIELGDHSIFPVAYSEGRAPASEDEIALSAMNASELGKKLGDRITLAVEGGERQFQISGIYSDITNGGKTAKAIFSDQSSPIMWHVIYANLSDQALVDSKVSEYAKKFDYAKVSDIGEYMDQTYGPTISAVQKGSYSAMAIALVIALLVSMLFMKMVVAKDRYAIAVMKAFGFSNKDIQAQYIARAVFVLLIAIVMGTLLANTLGELLTGAVISSFGAAAFQFTVNPLSAYLLSPLMLIGSVLIATLIGTSRAGQISISEHIKE